MAGAFTFPPDASLVRTLLFMFRDVTGSPITPYMKIESRSSCPLYVDHEKVMNISNYEQVSDDLQLGFSLL